MPVLLNELLTHSKNVSILVGLFGEYFLLAPDHAKTPEQLVEIGAAYIGFAWLLVVK